MHVVLLLKSAVNSSMDPAGENMLLPVWYKMLNRGNFPSWIKCLHVCDVTGRSRACIKQSSWGPRWQWNLAQGWQRKELKCVREVIWCVGPKLTAIFSRIFTNCSASLLFCFCGKLHGHCREQSWARAVCWSVSCPKGKCYHHLAQNKSRVMPTHQHWAETIQGIKALG